MGDFFGDSARDVVGAALDAAVPGAVELGALDYVEALLTALDHDPPRIWAAPGSWSGATAHWIELGPWERHAWAARIAGLRLVYERVIAGTDDDADRRVLYDHACEATYGDPAYGGNRGGGGWQRIDFPEPLFPPARTTGGTS